MNVAIRYLTFLVLLATGTVYAAPALVNYQGFLTDAGGQPLNDVMSVTFRIWTKLDAASSTVASHLVWAEKHESVSVVDGRINVILGTGTRVESDLEAAQNAADDLGRTFQEEVTYIGITLNDDEQYDPGEEITPRQQLLSVPYALNAGGSVLSGFDDSALADPGDVGKVVEIAADQNTLRLAKDIATRYRLVRGIYLGDGRIQLAGMAAVQRADLTPGDPVYLSLQVAGAVEKYGEISNRSLATLVGYAVDESRVRLNFTYTQLNDELISPEDVALLQDPGFEILNSPVWKATDGAANAANTTTNQASDFCGTSYANPAGRNLYQFVEIPANLHDLVDSGGMLVIYGGSNCCVSAAGEYRIDFYTGQPSSDLDAGFEQYTLPFSENNTGCNDRSNTVCIPCGTRKIRLLLDCKGNFIRWDDIQLRFSLSAPGQCEVPCP